MARKPKPQTEAPTPAPTPTATGFASKTPAQQRAIVHNAAVGDRNQCAKLALFWRERGQEKLANHYLDAMREAMRIFEVTLPQAEVSDPLPLMLQCVRNHATRHGWALAANDDATLTAVITGAKTVAGAIAKAAVAEKGGKA